MSDFDDLEIYPVKMDDVNEGERELPEVFPKGSYNMIVTGSSMTGKSAFVSNLCMRPSMLGARKNGDKIERHFEDIIVISGTLGQDKSLKPVQDIATMCYDHYSDAIVKRILDFQKDRKARGDDKKCLLILDDIISQCKPTDYIWRLFTSSRHYNLSIWVCVQAIRGTLSPIARANTHAWACYRLHSEKERVKLFEDLAFLDDEKEVKAMYEECVKEPYNFMFVDSRRLQVHHNLTEKLWERYDENGRYNPSFSQMRSSNELAKNSLESGITSNKEN